MRNEKDYCDFIEGNLREIVCRCLFDELRYYTREFPIGKGKVDFHITCSDDRRYIIECKYIRAATTIDYCLNGITQLLYYKCVARRESIPVDFLVLLTNVGVPQIEWIVSEYKLPIYTANIDKHKMEIFREMEKPPI